MSNKSRSRFTFHFVKKFDSFSKTFFFWSPSHVLRRCCHPGGAITHNHGQSVAIQGLRSGALDAAAAGRGAPALVCKLGPGPGLPVWPRNKRRRPAGGAEISDFKLGWLHGRSLRLIRDWHSNHDDRDMRARATMAAVGMCPCDSESDVLLPVTRRAEVRRSFVTTTVREESLTPQGRHR